MKEINNKKVVKEILYGIVIIINILIISAVINFVINNSSDCVDGSMLMSAQEKGMFNKQFEQYEGEKVNGANVRALLMKIKSNNSSNSDILERKRSFCNIL